jgi:hypothetical protein
MTRDKLYSYVALAAILIGLMFLYSLRAEAGTATPNWTAPSTKADGTPLAPAAIIRFEIEYSTSSTFAPLMGTVTAPGTATSVTINNLSTGTYYFRAFAVSAAGRSGPSNVASKLVPDSPPSPPVLTTIETVAYELRDSWFGKRMVAVGSVGLGETCGKPWVRDTSYARLTASQVALGRKYRGGKLFGSCA